MNIAEFSALVGTTSKTIYGKINNNSNLPVNEQLKTVKEKVKGREVTLIITNDEQIELYKNLYGKDTVINGEYYETVTDINSNSPVNENQGLVKINHNADLLAEMFDRLNTVHNEYNNRLQRVNDELITYKSKTLLLEDAKGREGYHINEINESKKENNRYKLVNYLLITLLAILLIFITGFITYNIAVNKGNEPQEEIKQEPVIEQVQPQPKPVQKQIKKK